MTGVPRHVAKHRLNVREGCQPIRQKKRGQAAERNIAINEEELIAKLPMLIAPKEKEELIIYLAASKKE
ncbi:hypothetical protein Tco_0402920, partial [Tanacetum coccineum]